MRINEPGAIGGGVAKKKKAGGAGGDFGSLLRTGETNAAAETEAPVSLAPVAGLFQLPGLDPGEAAQHEIARGHSMLDLLEEMRLNLLDGRAHPQVIQRLLKEIQDAPGYHPDPALTAIIDGISLRAQVELAKLGN